MVLTSSGGAGGAVRLLQGLPGAFDGAGAHAVGAEARAAAAAAAQPGIEQVADRVAEHVEAVHHHRERHPGHIARRGAISMNWRPSRLSIPPQLGTVVGRPKPRKLRLDSAMMMPPMVIEKVTMTAP